MAMNIKDFTPEEIKILQKENHDVEVITIVVIFTLLSVITTVLRLTSRHMKKTAVGIDDFLIIIGLVRGSLSKQSLCTPKVALC